MSKLLPQKEQLNKNTKPPLENKSNYKKQKRITRLWFNKKKRKRLQLRKNKKKRPKMLLLRPQKIHHKLRCLLPLTMLLPR